MAEPETIWRWAQLFLQGGSAQIVCQVDFDPYEGVPASRAWLLVRRVTRILENISQSGTTLVSSPWIALARGDVESTCLLASSSIALLAYPTEKAIKDLEERWARIENGAPNVLKAACKLVNPAGEPL